jgi:peptidoglycan-associated lipoprotein
MRKKLFGGIVFLCVGTLLSAGCAKKEIVKSEEPVAPSKKTTPPPAPEAVRPAPSPPEPVRSEPITETPAKESTIAPETSTTATAGSDQLQGELQKIYFNFDSADLSDDSRSNLSKNAEMLSKRAGVKIRIEGNCDERGSDEYNMALGERRARAARDYLVNLGVQGERISIISYGEEKPVDPGHDEAAWAKNRRDEFIIVK